MSRNIRNGVGELIMRVDQYNARVETSNPGGDRLVFTNEMRADLQTLNKLGLEICQSLKEIMDREP
jgi:hypothetical protein